MPRHSFARRVQFEQLLGHVAHGTTDPGLGLGPGGPTEPVQGGFRGPGVFLQQVELLDRDKQLVLADVAQLHEFVLLEPDRDLPQTDEDPDAVVHVHNVVADLEVAKV